MNAAGMVAMAILLTISSLTTAQAASQTNIFTSEQHCPCSSRAQLMSWKAGTQWENSTFGLGCARHEENWTECTTTTTAAMDAACDGTVIPRPAHCDGSAGGIPDYCDDACMQPSNGG